MFLAAELCQEADKEVSISVYFVDKGGEKELTLIVSIY